jgi:hypothetical protein
MIDNKVSTLIITQNDEATGILTSTDLLKALIDSEEEKEPGIFATYGVLLESEIGQFANTLANAGI